MARKRKTKRRIMRKGSARSRSVKKRRKSKVTMAKKKKYRRRSTSGFNLMKEIVPIGITVATEPLLDQLVDQFAGGLAIPQLGGIQMDDIAKVGLGYFVGKRSGLAGKVAKEYGRIGARNIVRQFVGGVLTPQTQQASPNLI